MSDETTRPGPDDTQPLAAPADAAPVPAPAPSPAPAGPALAPASVPYPAAATGPVTSLPLAPGAPGAPGAHPVPATTGRRGLPAWGIAAAAVGGVLVLGLTFAGGFGTGLLVGNQRSPMMWGQVSDRLEQRLDRDGDGDRDRGDRLGGGRWGDGDGPYAPGPGTDG